MSGSTSYSRQGPSLTLLTHTFLSKLYSKLGCDDQPILEHTEQLLAELGGAVEGDEDQGDPDLEGDYEPCSDEEEEHDEGDDAPMEH